VLAFESYWFAEHKVDPAQVRTIIDCGANIGLSALYFTSRYPKAQIISIEPDPANFTLLCKNTENETRIVPVHAAQVGESRTVVNLRQDRPAWDNRIANATGRSDTVQVPAITIDELVHRFDLDEIDVLKVNIEGEEKDLFARP